jgi:hypothetical protein
MTASATSAAHARDVPARPLQRGAGRGAVRRARRHRGPRLGDRRAPEGRWAPPPPASDLHVRRAPADRRPFCPMRAARTGATAARTPRGERRAVELPALRHRSPSDRSTCLEVRTAATRRRARSCADGAARAPARIAGLAAIACGAAAARSLSPPTADAERVLTATGGSVTVRTPGQPKLLAVWPRTERMDDRARLDPEGAGQGRGGRSRAAGPVTGLPVSACSTPPSSRASSPATG